MSKSYNLDPGQATISSLNYNTDEISCAIGLASLNRVDEQYLKELNSMGSSKAMNAENLIFQHTHIFPGSSPFYCQLL